MQTLRKALSVAALAAAVGLWIGLASAAADNAGSGAPSVSWPNALPKSGAAAAPAPASAPAAPAVQQAQAGAEGGGSAAGGGGAGSASGGGQGAQGGRGRGGMGGTAGYGSIVDAGSVLIALTPSQQLIVFEPSDKGFKQLAKYKVSDTPTFAYPVLAGNRIFIKDRDTLALWTIE